MPKVQFLAHLKKLVGVSHFDLGNVHVSVKDALVDLADRFPQIKELILDEVPEVIFILGNKTLLVPNDLNKPFDDDLIIGPIVAGGCN